MKFIIYVKFNIRVKLTKFIIYIKFCSIENFYSTVFSLQCCEIRGILCARFYEILQNNFNFNLY